MKYIALHFKILGCLEKSYLAIFQSRSNKQEATWPVSCETTTKCFKATLKYLFVAGICWNSYSRILDGTVW